MGQSACFREKLIVRARRAANHSFKGISKALGGPRNPFSGFGSPVDSTGVRPEGSGPDRDALAAASALQSIIPRGARGPMQRLLGRHFRPSFRANSPSHRARSGQSAWAASASRVRIHGITAEAKRSGCSVACPPEGGATQTKRRGRGSGRRRPIPLRCAVIGYISPRGRCARWSRS